MMPAIKVLDSTESIRQELEQLIDLSLITRRVAALFSHVTAFSCCPAVRLSVKYYTGIATRPS